jgi:hypothetical protein
LKPDIVHYGLLCPCGVAHPARMKKPAVRRVA